jgi:ribosomal protein S18 acetylase RimI-like enzyme
MAMVLEDVSPAGMARAIAQDFAAALRTLASTPYGEVHDEPDLLWLLTGLPSPFFNGVYRTELAPELGPEAIQWRVAEILEAFRARGVAMQWTVTPLTRPADLRRHLEAAGMTIGDSQPGMAVDLLALREPPMPAGLTIERVADDETARVWNRVGIRGFEMPSELEPAFERVVLALTRQTEPGTLYLGRLDGEPVATSALVTAGGTAGIYNVATLAEARRKGIGAALTARALLDGRARGLRIGTLQASTMGYPVYQAMGFREYIRLEHYVWQP